jgi:hypothetical protein
MPLVPTTEIKQSDTYVFVPAALTGTAATLSASACGIRAWVTPFPVRLVQMTVYTGAGTVSTTTFTPAYGTSTGGIALLGTTLAATATAPASASAATDLGIDTIDSTTTLPPIVPAGSAIGINIPAVGSQAVTIVGIGFRYRPA